MEFKIVNNSNIPLMLTIKETAHNNLGNFKGISENIIYTLLSPYL